MQQTGGNGYATDFRPGLAFDQLEHTVAIDRVSAKLKAEDGNGLRYRKQRTVMMMDYYPVSGFHISAGYRSWKGRLPKSEFGSANSVGRLNMLAVAPLLPIKSGRSNRAPIATMGYQTNVAKFTQIGFETGVVSDHGSNWLSSDHANDPNRTWSKTGMMAQASMRLRFF